MTIPKDSKRAAAAAADWLDIPSVDSDEDYNRRKNLYELFELNSSDDKYLSGYLGEAIVELYFWVLNKTYHRNPPAVMLEELGKTKRIRPDGELNEENESFYVEVKTRAYCSNGTSDEKIPNISFKYRNVGKKLKVVFLADDEHRCNLYWTQLIRGTIEPKPDSMEFYTQKANAEVIDEIILGTEVAKVLREYAETTIEMGG